MKERVIDLDINTYEKLVEIIDSDQDNINFKCGGCDDMVRIPNKSKNKSNSEQNIVQRWMNDIIEMAAQGYRETNDHDAEDYFHNIQAYCQAVIVSVTS